jgi:hypothetical protein
MGIAFKFLLDVIFSLVYTNYELLQPFGNYLATIFLTYLVFEILFLINKRLNKRYNWDTHPYHRFVIQIFLNLIVAIVIIEGFRWGYKLIFGLVYYISLLDELIIVGFIAFIVFAFVFSELSIFLLNKWRFSLAELERFKKENVEIRFESLRTQLNPHFMFNSLNTLSSLIYENQENAALFIRELSDVYRYILENRDRELVPLKNEVDFANSYIFLIRLRFENNLDIVSEIKNPELKYNIAPLTLQLLIENAVKHNIISKKYPLRLHIYIEKDILVVTNNLQPKQTKEYSSKMGLKNIQSRYGFLTDKKVEILQSENDFKVKIPLILN